MTMSVTEPCHRERPSLLSATSGYENYRGFLNLLYVLVGLGSCRLVIENILQYGLLIEFDWPIRFLRDPTSWPSIFMIVLVNIFILIEFYLEKLLSRTNEKRWIFYQFVNLFCLLVFPPIYISYREINPIGALLGVSIYSIVCLKLFSYLHVNYQCRCRRKIDEEKKKSTMIYPANLTLTNLFYFIIAPTLCYELKFARSSTIRKAFLLRRIGEILVLLSLQYCLSQQWILPILRTLDRPLSDYSFLENLERILRLALPNHLLWLSFFYVYFHSILNLLAELISFPDRLFYRDWWNATDLYEFWNRWNILVHQFCKRHIYKPLVVQYGYSPSIGALIVFALSAFFHEYLISVSLRMIRPWSFLAMIVQLPMGFVVRWIKKHNPTYGNLAVWMSLILIQPIALLLYIQDFFYRDFIPHHHTYITELN